MTKFAMGNGSIHLVLLPQNRTNGDKFYAAQMNVNALDVKTYKGFAEQKDGGAWAWVSYEDACEHAHVLREGGVQVDRVIKIGYGGWEIMEIPPIMKKDPRIKAKPEAINHPDAGSW